MLNKTLVKKLEILCERYEEVSNLLSDSEIISEQNKFRELSKEYSSLEPIDNTYKKLVIANNSIADAKEMRESGDNELKEFANIEIEEANNTIENLSK